MKSLVLIPSHAEQQLFQNGIDDRWSVIEEPSLEICGVGMVASAVGTTSLLHKLQPDQVFLIGIAGLFNSASPTADDLTPLSIADAVVATSVVQHGIGVGEGAKYHSAESMGFLRFNRDIHLQTPDKITLQGSTTKTQSGPVGQFLTVMSASSCKQEAEQRRIAYPDALVEDMETYSVALACHTAGIPLTAIRGISNVAGDRDFNNWDSKAAMRAASNILLDYLS